MNDGSGNSGGNSVVDRSWVQGPQDQIIGAGNTPPVTAWPLCGPPNKDAQVKADAVYFADADKKLQVSDVHEPVILKQATCTNRGGNSVPAISEFELNVNEVFAAAQDLLIRKNRDYSSKNIGHSPFGPERGLLTRMHDKMCRLVNLIEKGDENPNFESLRDSAVDMMNYSAILILVLDAKWPMS